VYFGATVLLALLLIERLTLRRWLETRWYS